MRGLKGYGFFVVMAVIILMAALSGDFFSGMNRNNYSYTQFKKEIEDHQIAAVVVEQNQEVPTGEVTVKTKDDVQKSFFTPDVNTVINYLDSVGFTNVKVSDVATTPWFLTILPYIIGFVLIFLLFTMMTGHTQGGGGANAKMMNFGKSRAKVTAPEDRKSVV